MIGVKATTVAMAATVALVAILSLLPRGEAVNPVTCYSCAGSMGRGYCETVSSSTPTEICRTGCQTSTMGIMIHRGCGTDSVCRGNSLSKYCSTTCNTDLCNRNDPPTPRNHATTPTLRNHATAPTAPLILASLTTLLISLGVSLA